MLKNYSGGHSSAERTAMIGDLFDSPWKILIVAAVLIVLFGSAKLPAAARSLGKSVRILKTEVKGLHEDDGEPGPATPAAALTQPPATASAGPGEVGDRRQARRAGRPGS
jgi:sec-independent protein translocase protein TatA